MGYLRKIFALGVLVLAAMWTSSPSQGADYDVFQLESKIEDLVKEIISNHLDPADYVVLVTINEEESKKPEDTKKEPSSVPFTSLKIEPEALQESLKYNSPNQIFTVALTIEILFDESVFEERRKVIVDKVTKSLKIDNQKRTIKVTSAKLKAIKEEKVIEPNESLKIEMERTKLEIEREKTAATQRELTLKKQLDEAKAAVPPPPEHKKTVIETLQDFQIAIFAVILAVCLLLFVILGSSGFKSGSGTISEALIQVGDTLAKAGGGGGGAGGGGGVTTAEVAQTIESAEAGSGGTTEVTSGTDDKRAGFLNLVEDKIDVLAKEGNFNFYRNFIDLIQKNITYAAAILVSVKEDSAKQLVSYLAPELISRISEFLDDPEGLKSAKRARASALEAFYGAIAMDEFTSSPLAQKKEIEWLIKLTNAELLDLATQLDNEVRTVFLACFSPTRLSLILEQTKDETQKDKIIASLVNIDSVTFNDIEAVFAKAEQVYKQSKAAAEETVRKLVDGPRYIANVITNISDLNRNKVLAKLSERSDLLEGIRRYYIPFDTIIKLADHLVSDIFSKRPTTQVALAMFSANKELQDIIIKAMPEMIRDTIREELDSLQADKSGDRANRAKSAQIQTEICRYLLMLNKDGLLEFKA